MILSFYRTAIVKYKYVLMEERSVGTFFYSLSPFYRFIMVILVEARGTGSGKFGDKPSSYLVIAIENCEPDRPITEEFCHTENLVSIGCTFVQLVSQLLGYPPYLQPVLPSLGNADCECPA